MHIRDSGGSKSQEAGIQIPIGGRLNKYNLLNVIFINMYDTC